MNLFDSSAIRRYHTTDEAIITASYSTVTSLVLDAWLMGSIAQQSSFLLYKIDSTQLKRSGSLIVEFAECLGESQVKFLSNPDQTYSKISVKEH